MTDYILVTNWETVPKDDFYLSTSWKENVDKENFKKAKELSKKGRLYYGYIVPATNYALYHTLDAHQVLIDEDCNVLIECENEVINNEHEYKCQYDI